MAACSTSGRTSRGPRAAGRSTTGPRPTRSSSTCATPARCTSIAAASSSPRCSGGSLHDQLAFSGLEFLPIQHILTRGLDALRPRAAGAGARSAARDVRFRVDVAAQHGSGIVNGVKDHGHGGTVLLVAPGAEATMPIRLKYARRGTASTSGGPVRRVRELAARARGRARRRSRGDDDPQAAVALPHLRNAAYVAEEELADAADLAARLDGRRRRAGDDRRLARAGFRRGDRAGRGEAGQGVRGDRTRAPRRGVAGGRQRELRHAASIGAAMRLRSPRTPPRSSSRRTAPSASSGGRTASVLMKRNVNTSNPNMGE